MPHTRPPAPPPTAPEIETPEALKRAVLAVLPKLSTKPDADIDGGHPPADQVAELHALLSHPACSPPLIADLLTKTRRCSASAQFWVIVTVVRHPRWRVVLAGDTMWMTRFSLNVQLPPTQLGATLDDEDAILLARMLAPRPSSTLLRSANISLLAGPLNEGRATAILAAMTLVDDHRLDLFDALLVRGLVDDTVTALTITRLALELIPALPPARRDLLLRVLGRLQPRIEKLSGGVATSPTLTTDAAPPTHRSASRSAP